jgi:N-methylhydantoinase A
VGQLHAVEVSVAPGQIDQAFLAGLREDFLRNYERLFGPGTSSAEAGVEAITLRVDALGKTSVPALAASPAPSAIATPEGRRQVWWQGRLHDAGRFRGPLPPGHRLFGPAVVDHEGNTVWVPPGLTAQVDGWGNLVMEIA